MTRIPELPILLSLARLLRLLVLVLRGEVGAVGTIDDDGDGGGGDCCRCCFQLEEKVDVVVVVAATAAADVVAVDTVASTVATCDDEVRDEAAAAGLDLADIDEDDDGGSGVAVVDAAEERLNIMTLSLIFSVFVRDRNRTATENKFRLSNAGPNKNYGRSWYVIYSEIVDDRSVVMELFFRDKESAK